MRIVHRALDAGINIIDTADMYGARSSPRTSSERRCVAAVTTLSSRPSSTVRWAWRRSAW
ncbi:aldo/keto reductase [Nocardia sp. NPDC005998]|uniref:aldo/keto reductase n=1 Tax=Nocardia sp. NPDC005998 TaxID=3156894 RepID=UPI0033AF88C6